MPKFLFVQNKKRRDFIFAALIIAIYPKLISPWGYPDKSIQLLLDLPLSLLFFTIIYIPLKETYTRFIIALLPILFFNLLHDTYYALTRRTLRICDLSLIPQLFTYLPAYMLILLIIFVTAPILTVLWKINWKNYRALLLSASMLTIIVTVIALFPAPIAKVWNISSLEAWDNIVSLRRTGRIGYFIAEDARRRFISNSLTQQPKLIRLSPNTIISTPPDVHIIVMESWLNPLFLSKVKYSRSPIFEDFEKKYASYMSLSRSPVAINSTAQAEFEILCGVPALAKFTAVEFQSMTGNITNCLPDILQNNGFDTIASRTDGPEVFNVFDGMKSLGFKEIYFPREYAKKMQTYIHRGDTDGAYMFDGYFFDQNIKFLKQRTSTKPLLNYVIGEYGHHPYNINPQVRPLLIDVSEKLDSLHNVANQVYYRTKALGKYITELQQISPHSIIIIASDHLPNLNSTLSIYQTLGYLNNDPAKTQHNQALIIINDKPTMLPNLTHYSLFDVVLNELTNNAYCQQQKCLFKQSGYTNSELENRYLQIMSAAH